MLTNADLKRGGLTGVIDQRGSPDTKAAEKKRLAEALRANLKRRKAAAAGRLEAERSELGQASVDANRAGKDCKD